MIEERVTRAYTDVGMVPTPAPPGFVGGCASLSAGTSLVDRTNALIRGLDLILDHHKVNSTIRVALANQVHDYLDNSLTEATWLKRGKFLLACPFAKYLNNELPEFPDCGPFVPKGPLKRFMKNRLLNYCPKNTHFWFSWMQAKRSCLPASEDMINQAYDKHYATLSKQDDGDAETIEQIMTNPDFIAHLDEIRAGVQSFFLKNTKGFNERHASLSASYESNRTDVGSHGALHRMVTGRPEGDLSYWINPKDQLSRMVFLPRSFDGRKINLNKTYEIRSTDTFENLQDWKEGLIFSRTQLKRRILAAKIQGIVEPMKVRVISKGPALEYYCMQELQKALHSTMRNMPCYRLIGRPLSPTDVPDLYVAPIKYGLQGDEEWISVDYSAATDGLSWKYSGRIFEYLIQDLPERIRGEAMDVLGPHYLQYPKKDGRGYEEEPRGKMNRGQLMGSILSFPVLCAANTGLYLHVTRDYQQGWKLWERLNSVLVNGDDQLYLAPNHVFHKHIKEGLKVGLEMTVGKAYHHKSYTNVNSTCVNCPIGGTPRQIDFLNTGLFFGQNKVMSKVSTVDQKEEEKPRSGIVTVLNEVLRGSLPGRQSDLLTAWFKQHSRDEIEKDTYVILQRGGIHQRNLFLPIIMGGMGVVPPLGWKFAVTLRDRKYAAEINKGRVNCMTIQGPQLPALAVVDTQDSLCSYNISKDVDSTRSQIKIRKSTVPKFFSVQNLRRPYVVGFNRPSSQQVEPVILAMDNYSACITAPTA